MQLFLVVNPEAGLAESGNCYADRPIQAEDWMPKKQQIAAQTLHKSEAYSYSLWQPEFSTPTCAKHVGAPVEKQLDKDNCDKHITEAIHWIMFVSPKELAKTTHPHSQGLNRKPLTVVLIQ